MADLKGLTARARPVAQAAASFGPSNMLGGRANSRRGMTGTSGLGIRDR